MNNKLRSMIIKHFLNTNYGYICEDPDEFEGPLVDLLSFSKHLEIHNADKFYCIFGLCWSRKLLDFCLIVQSTKIKNRTRSHSYTLSSQKHGHGATHSINLNLKSNPQMLEYLSLKYDGINFKSYLE